MTDNPKPHRNSRDDGRKAGSRRGSLNRTIILSMIAMTAGFFLASRIDWLWQDNSGVKHDFEVMNTYARITIPASKRSAKAPSELAGIAEQAVRRVDDLMSPFGEASDIRRLNAAPAGQWIEVHPLTWQVVMEALRWNRLSEGAFDPTIGPIKSLFTFNQGEIESWPDTEVLIEAKAKVGADKILFEREGMRLAWAKDGMKLDLGALAKGFGADQAAAVLAANGVTNALVDIGGELRVLGNKPSDAPAPWQAGVRNPRGDGFTMVLPVADEAVATSGDYEKFFMYKGSRYEHIIDPRRGLPLTESVASVTVIHPNSCMAADALATTMCVLGPAEGEAFLRRQALGLFSAGVRVIMLKIGEDEAVEKIEYAIDDKGEVTVTTDTL